jgi:hypothetical protein
MFVGDDERLGVADDRPETLNIGKLVGAELGQPIGAFVIVLVRNR